MRDSKSRPLIPEVDALTTAPQDIFNSVILFFLFQATYIYNEFKHGQNCVKAIGTPFMSANSVNTRGVPIVSCKVSVETVKRVSSLTIRSLPVKCYHQNSLFRKTVNKLFLSRRVSVI